MALSAFTAATAEPDLLSSLGQLEEAFKSGDPVSYTHLTLPTILLV